jgi:hypothetical protein
MRAEGFPSRVAVASVIALGSVSSARAAASNHFLNNRIGSEAANFQCKLKA